MMVCGKRWVPVRVGVWISAAAVTALLGFTVFLGDLRLSGNFHAVVAGEFYRSAQPTPHELDRYAARYGLKSVINLRGPHQGFAWYDAEKAENARLGIRQIDFRISSITQMSDRDIVRLIRVLRKAQKPILVHCQAGADRSGLVSALYLAAIDGVDMKKAARQLSIRYGHFSTPLSRTYAMDQTFREFEASRTVPNS